jgi:hypothetical protein
MRALHPRTGARTRCWRAPAHRGCTRRTMMSSMSSAVSVSVMSRNCNGGVRHGTVAPLRAGPLHCCICHLLSVALLHLLHCCTVAPLSVALLSVALLSVASVALLHGRTVVCCTVARSHRCVLDIVWRTLTPRSHAAAMGRPVPAAVRPPHPSRTRPPRPTHCPCNAAQRAALPPTRQTRARAAEPASAFGSITVRKFPRFGVRKFRDWTLRDSEVSAFHCLPACQPRTRVRSPAEPLPAPVRI